MSFPVGGAKTHLWKEKTDEQCARPRNVQPHQERDRRKRGGGAEGAVRGSIQVIFGSKMVVVNVVNVWRLLEPTFTFLIEEKRYELLKVCTKNYDYMLFYVLS